MVTYSFQCNKCKIVFEKFRFGHENLKKWKDGKLEVKCECGSTDVQQVLTKGSGQFKRFSW